MTIRNRIDALMARFGYVPAASVPSPTSIPLKIEVDNTGVRETLALLEQVAAAAREAEAGTTKVAECLERMSLHQLIADSISHAQRTSSDASRAAKEAAAAYTEALRM
jgi:hypothetical protein